MITVGRLLLCLLLATSYAMAYRTFNAEPRHFVLDARLAQQTPRNLPCELDLSLPVASGDARLAGWSYPEAWGSWTNGNDASIGARFPPEWAGAVVAIDFDIVHLSLGGPGHRRTLHVDVLVNGVHCARWDFDEYPPLNRRVFATLPTNEPQALIHLRIHNPISPAQAGLSTDRRALGMGIGRIRISATTEKSDG